MCVCVSGGMQVVDERALTLGFQQWLAGVTERIHQTMHYQFDGKEEDRTAFTFMAEDLRPYSGGILHFLLAEILPE